jgi:hypothetical protein
VAGGVLPPLRGGDADLPSAVAVTVWLSADEAWRCPGPALPPRRAEASRFVLPGARAPRGGGVCVILGKVEAPRLDGCSSSPSVSTGSAAARSTMVAESSVRMYSASGRVNGLRVGAPAVIDGEVIASGNLRLRRATEQSLQLRPWDNEALSQPDRRNLSATSKLVRQGTSDTERSPCFLDAERLPFDGCRLVRFHARQSVPT